MSTEPLTEHELKFYYSGLYRALKRYRFATIVGWGIVAVGLLSIPFGWGVVRSLALLDIVLSVCVIVAGLVLVQQSVTFLDAYIGVPFPPRKPGNGADDVPPAVQEILQLMHEVDRGGWQEAYAAIGVLRTLEKKYGLPSLE